MFKLLLTLVIATRYKVPTGGIEHSSLLGYDTVPLAMQFRCFAGSLGFTLNA